MSNLRAFRRHVAMQPVATTHPFGDLRLTREQLDAGELARVTILAALAGDTDPVAHLFEGIGPKGVTDVVAAVFAYAAALTAAHAAATGEPIESVLDALRAG